MTQRKKIFQISCPLLTIISTELCTKFQIYAVKQRVKTDFKVLAIFTFWDKMPHDGTKIVPLTI